MGDFLGVGVQARKPEVEGELLAFRDHLQSAEKDTVKDQFSIWELKGDSNSTQLNLTTGLTAVNECTTHRCREASRHT